MTALPSRTELRAAHERVSPHLHRTPVFTSQLVDEAVGVPVRLKAESLQKTGSFKPRGILNKVLAVDTDVVTVSAGNAAAALAWAGNVAGRKATVVMPESASPTKVAACEGYGAEVILRGTVHEAFEHALQLRDERNLAFVHPFDDPHVVAGHAGVAFELLEQVPDLGTVIVPVGGGGLISGIAAGLRAEGHDTEIYGVEPDGACAMRRSLDRGKPVRLDTVDTIADGLAPPMAGNLNYAIVKEALTDVVTVGDDWIREAMRLLMSRTKLVVEPSGAVGIAALLSGAIRPGRPGSVVVVLSGGNLDAKHLA
ncbi:MAG: threonine/serine dehydratase [Gemmatimonadales bacterium]